MNKFRLGVVVFSVIILNSSSVFAHVKRCPGLIECEKNSCKIVDGTPGSIADWYWFFPQVKEKITAKFDKYASVSEDGTGACGYKFSLQGSSIIFSQIHEYDVKKVGDFNPHFTRGPLGQGLKCEGESKYCQFEPD